MSMSIDSMASMLNTTNTDATTNYNANALKKSLNGVSSDTSADELMQVCKDFESYFVEEVIKEVKKNLLLVQLQLHLIVQWDSVTDLNQLSTMNV